MTRRIYLSLGYAAGLLAALVLGSRYFEARIKPGLFPRSTRVGLSLLEVNGSLYEFAKHRGAKPTVIFYLPDDVSFETQQKYSNIVRAHANRREKPKEMILVSRMDTDTLRNMKRISGFVGPFLSDPSGSLLRKVREWEFERKSQEWTTIELSKEGEILRYKSGDAPEASWLE